MPIWHYMRVLDFLYDNRLRSSFFESFCWTYCEICKQGRLSARVIAIKIPAHQINRVVVGGKEHVVCTDVPDCEKSVSSI